MNKELIKKYKPEFDHWLNGGKLLYNCGQSWIECLKGFRWDNDVRNDLQFIINDEYVEFRKALAEGKTLQLNEAEKFGDPKRGWVDLSCTDLGHSRVLFPVEFYRIKPEEPQFKVGDWLFDLCYDKYYKILNILEDKVETETFRVYKSAINGVHYEIWKPKIGEWVIPDTGIDDKMFVVMKYDGVSLIADRCQPFIGKLPK